MDDEDIFYEHSTRRVAKQLEAEIRSVKSLFDVAPDFSVLSSDGNVAGRVDEYQRYLDTVKDWETLDAYVNSADLRRAGAMDHTLKASNIVRPMAFKFRVVYAYCDGRKYALEWLKAVAVEAKAQKRRREDARKAMQEEGAIAPRVSYGYYTWANTSTTSSTTSANWR